MKTDVVILGGGVIGLATAMLLARSGFEVMVLERDGAELPDDALDWDRRGVAQFNQPHYLHSQFRRLAEAELPDVVDALVAAGARSFNLASMAPHTLADRGLRPGDDRFATVTARRPVVEAVFARIAANHPGIDVRRGVSVDGLIEGTSAGGGIPRVAGVRTGDGATITADLVVDAMGRRSPSAEWLSAVGARPPEAERDRHGFTYYTRSFRGALPDAVSSPLQQLGAVSIVTLPADNDTWWIIVFASSSDRPLKALRDVRRWTSVVAASPYQAHWLDGEPITDIVTMGGLANRLQSFSVDGRPVATGFAAVGDALFCTNPTNGRGLSLGLLQATRLRDAVTASISDPAELASRWNDTCTREFVPWFRLQASTDASRCAQIDALLAGKRPADPSGLQADLMKASTLDPEVFRGALEVLSSLSLPEEVLSRPGMLDRIRNALLNSVRAPEPRGPSRDVLLALVA